MFSKYSPKLLLTPKYIEINKLLDELAIVHNEYQQKTQAIIEKIKRHKMCDRDIWMHEYYLLRKHNMNPIYEPMQQIPKIYHRSMSEPHTLNSMKTNGDVRISFV